GRRRRPPAWAGRGRGRAYWTGRRRPPRRPPAPPVLPACSWPRLRRRKATMPSTTPVSDVMTKKVITMTPDQTFEQAADVLAEHKIGAVPIVDAGGTLVGLLRDEDLIVSESNVHAPTWLNFFGVEFPVPGSQKHFEEELKRMVAAT